MLAFASCRFRPKSAPGLERQTDACRKSAVQCVRDVHSPTLERYEAANDRQAEAGLLAGARTGERVGEPRQLTTGTPGGFPNRERNSIALPARLHGDEAALGRELDRGREQMEKKFPAGARIGMQLWQIGPDVRRKRNARPVGCEPYGAAAVRDEVCHVQGLGGEIVAPGVDGREIDE